ncbi:MAG TPA: hypothetical protein VE956_16420 [Nodularia sp. (in: cyanobacteria)]|nr:hypothetical protein [Nodularia sp. (in: cyanobacteria)]
MDTHLCETSTGNDLFGGNSSVWGGEKMTRVGVDVSFTLILAIS